MAPPPWRLFFSYPHHASRAITAEPTARSSSRDHSESGSAICFASSADVNRNAPPGTGSASTTPLRFRLSIARLSLGQISRQHRPRQRGLWHRRPRPGRWRRLSPQIQRHRGQPGLPCAGAKHTACICAPTYVHTIMLRPKLCDTSPVCRLAIPKRRSATPSSRNQCITTPNKVHLHMVTSAHSLSTEV